LQRQKHQADSTRPGTGSDRDASPLQRVLAPEPVRERLPRMNSFDPELASVFTSSRVPLLPRTEDYYVAWHESELRTYEAEEDDDPTLVVARARWAVLNFDAAANDDQDMFWECDAHSQDLCTVYETIVDPKSGQFVCFEGWGNVLYFDTVEIKRGFDTRDIAREFIEHLLQQHPGCGAVFLFGERDSPKVRDAFKDRGFEALRKRGKADFLVLDLSHRRPPLPPLARDAVNVKRLRTRD
jgi:hypothetical protein